MIRSEEQASARPRAGAVVAHVLVASLPIGCFVAAASFDVASRLASEPYTFPHAAYWMFVLGVIGAVVSGLPGLFVLQAFDPSGERAHGARVHVVLTDVGIIAAVASLVLRQHTDLALSVRPAALALGVVAAVFTLVGAIVAAASRQRAVAG